MQIKLFDIPAFDASDAVDEMNRFLRGHKIIHVEQHLVQTPVSSYWSFCVKYQEGTVESSYSRSERKDYRNELDEATFRRFALLRDCRKQLAADLAVKSFMVFTDDELASIAQMPEIVAEKMIAIKGIGDKKIERYGYKLAEMYHQRLRHEASQSSDT